MPDGSQRSPRAQTDIAAAECHSCSMLRMINAPIDDDDLPDDFRKALEEAVND
jgi:hypothetical protein